MPDVMDELSKSQRPLEAEPVAEEPRRSPVKFIVLGMLVLALAAGAWAYFHFLDRVSSDDAEVDAHITAIAPKIPGNVLEVLAKDNQPVKAGDILVRIDPRDYQARVDIARAALLQAQSQLHTAQTVVPLTNETTQSGASGATAQLSDAMAELDRARLGYEQAASSDIAVVEANVRTKQASNERAQADLARMKPLLDKAEISRLQHDAYQPTARVADGHMRAAQEQVPSVQQNAGIQVPRRPVLPAERGAHPRARAARAPAGYQAAGRVFPRRFLRAQQLQAQDAGRFGLPDSGEPPVARQCTRAAQRHRAHGHPDGGRAAYARGDSGGDSSAAGPGAALQRTRGAGIGRARSYPARAGRGQLERVRRGPRARHGADQPA